MFKVVLALTHPATHVVSQLRAVHPAVSYGAAVGTKRCHGFPLASFLGTATLTLAAGFAYFVRLLQT